MEEEKAADVVGKSSRIKKIALAELGARLPIGVGPTLEKDFGVRVWKTKDERELGQKKKSAKRFGEFVTVVLGHMLSSLGGVAFGPELDANQRALMFSNMYVADVLYAWLYLRREAIGPTLDLRVTCPRCPDTKFQFAGDLNSVEIGTVDSLDDLTWTYVLKHPIEVRKKRVESFQVRTPTWGHIKDFIGDPNTSLAKLLAVRSAIIGVNGESAPVRLTENELDELSKVDFEGIFAGFSSPTEFLGPNMAIEVECPSCMHPLFQPIDWTYDGFFSISSR